MQAQVNQDGDVVVVHLLGRVDVETATPFREACLQKLSGQKVVFDFTRLSFVGSSGILPFLETLTQFHGVNPAGLKFSAVSSEFQKVFASTPLQSVQIYESAPMASQSYSNPLIRAIVAAPLHDNSADNSADEGSAV